jgi:hypothetical protein
MLVSMEDLPQIAALILFFIQTACANIKIS